MKWFKQRIQTQREDAADELWEILSKIDRIRQFVAQRTKDEELLDLLEEQRQLARNGFSTVQILRNLETIERQAMASNSSSGR